jgi:hypothetical protein
MKYLILITIFILGGLYGYNFKRVEKVASGYVISSGNPYKRADIQKIKTITKWSEQYATELWEVSDQYKIDYKILLAIGFLEHGYGLRCFSHSDSVFSPFGFNGCKTTFSTFRESVEKTVRMLTLHPLYSPHDLMGKACRWNIGKAQQCEYGRRLLNYIASI